MSLRETGPELTSGVPALSALGYGAANVGNLFRALTDDEAWAVLDAAWECGIRYFDTAPHYGLGLSERRLGAFLQTKPRDEFFVSTKAGRLLRPNDGDTTALDLDNDFHVPAALRRVWDFSAEGVRASLDESLERLGLERVDALYLHDPERFNLDRALSEGLPALRGLRDDGLVDAIGIGSMVNEALALAAETADLDLVMIAGRYTLLDTSAAEQVLPTFRRTHTRAVAASIFNSGLLASDTPTRKGRYEYGAVPDDVWQRLQRITDACRDHGVPLPAAAVQFALREPLIASVVVGASRPGQLAHTAEWAGVDIPAAFWQQLTAEGLIPEAQTSLM